MIYHHRVRFWTPNTTQHLSRTPTQRNTTQTPNTKHTRTRPNHAQKSNTDQNSEHKHALFEPRTPFFASPRFKASSERPGVQHTKKNVNNSPFCLVKGPVHNHCTTQSRRHSQRNASRKGGEVLNSAPNVDSTMIVSWATINYHLKSIWRIYFYPPPCLQAL